MAKKNKPRSNSSFPFLRLPLLFCLAALVAGIWWFWESRDLVYQYIENGEIATLESKYTPEQLMQAHHQELIGGDAKRSYQDPQLKYYPYLLLEVKYTEDNKSREGALLWGLKEGEIVLNTETWDTTHGFKDCLDCHANRQNFKVLQALARHKGSLSVEELQKELHVERDLLEAWVEDTKQKHLIAQKGNQIQLHFENPKLLVTPQTKLKHHIVLKPVQNGQRLARTYSRSQIIEAAKYAFGSDFTIRNEQEIFLPVYQLSVSNSDGSIHASDWNAVTGQKI